MRFYSALAQAEDGIIDFLVTSDDDMTLQAAAESFIDYGCPWDMLSGRDGTPLLRAYYPCGDVEVIYMDA